MAEEDFEIDVYGDGSAEQNSNENKTQDFNTQVYESNTNITVANGSNSSQAQANSHADYDQEQEQHMDTNEDAKLQPQQGIKRKESSDNRPIDPGATSCLLISDLHWSVTDDDVRAWARRAGCENELKDVTFSEHKVNGKSKGQAYIEFDSQQAATATKHEVDGSQASQPGGKKYSVIYSSPNTNPFRTLPKDAPARGKDQISRGGSNSGAYNDRPNNNMGSNFGGGYRGRGGFNGPRGGFNRNFSGGGNFNGGGFNNMGGNNFGFQPRGGMMGGAMRGGPGGMRGRGGMNNGMMGGMGGMGMPMGGMPGGMGMGMMGGMPGTLLC